MRLQTPNLLAALISAAALISVRLRARFVMAAPGAALDAVLQQLLAGLQQVQASVQQMQQHHQAPVALMRAIDHARRRNHHALNGVAYMVVPMDGGGPPPNWPAGGMTRAWLRSHAIAAVDALLGDYGQPVAGTAYERRNRLAEHIGTVGL